MRLAAAALIAALAFVPAHAQSPATDYVKRAGNFLENCDAREDAQGNRPEPNYVCLAFMAGLVEGYTYAAVANGNPRPYCLPRPATLAELADMMATVIERGVPPDLPTAAVFHFILQKNFECSPEDASAADGDGVQTAQANEPLLKVTPPEELDAREPKLPIKDPVITDVVPAGEAAPAAPTTPETAQPSTTAPLDRTDTRTATEGRPGTAVGTTEGADSAMGPGSALGAQSAEGPIDEPINQPPRMYSAPAANNNPLEQPSEVLSTPRRPSTPARPQGPRPATGN